MTDRRRTVADLSHAAVYADLRHQRPLRDCARSAGLAEVTEPSPSRLPVERIEESMARFEATSHAVGMRLASRLI